MLCSACEKYYQATRRQKGPYRDRGGLRLKEKKKKRSQETPEINTGVFLVLGLVWLQYSRLAGTMG